MKDGSDISLIGTSEVDGNIVIAFEEHQDRHQKDKEFTEPRIRLASITRHELKLLSINGNGLLNKLWYIEGEDSFTYEDETGIDEIVQLKDGTSKTIKGRKVAFNIVAKDIVEAIDKEAGAGWYEQMPSKIENGVVKEYKLFPDPVIPPLDAKHDQLPKDFDWKNAKLKFLNLKREDKNFNNNYPDDPTSAVAFAVDENTNTLLAARFDGTKWKWKVPGLREIGEAQGTNVAMTMDGGAEFWKNPKWLEIEKNDFNVGVIMPLWHEIAKNKDHLDFSYPDLQAEFAEKNKLKIHGESLVMSYFTPDWLKNGNFSTAELMKFYTETCRATVKHYKGRVKSWSAVIEPGFSPPYVDNDFWFKKLGPQYVEIACQIIREEDPDAKIIVGDFENFTKNGAKYQQTLDIVNNLKSKSVIDGTGKPRNLIDGVGVEISVRPPNGIPQKEEVIDALKSYGIPVYITQLEVNIRDLGPGDPDRFNTQAQVYKMFVDAALESGVCKQITFWGMGDKYSLEDSGSGGSPNADPTIFDDNLEPKPAYFAVMDSLKSHLFNS